jgi:VCBS repeat-containing protein
MLDAEYPTDGRGGRSGDEGPAGTQLAQAGAAAFGDPIGAVREVTGQVLIVHKDGTSEPAAIGLPVFANDIVATGPAGAVEVLFRDGTTFSLGENGQMRLDSLIFDPAGNNNGLDATVVKGSFVFITGQVGSAEGEGVSIDTPAGTIGIRGTSGGIAKDPVTGAWIITLFRDPDGTLSRFTFTNPVGARVLDQEFETTQVASRQAAPAQTIVLTPEQAVSIFAGALQMLQEQFPDLQPPEQRGDLDNIIPEAGGDFAVEPGVLLGVPEALAELYGLDALGGALADLISGGLLGDDGMVGGNGSSSISAPDQTFDPVAPSGPAPPVDVDPIPNVVPENVVPGSAVGITVLASDPRFNGPVTYSLLNDAGGRFVIDPVTGVVTVAPGADIDFEDDATFTIVVQATDGVRTSVAPMTITIANVNEAPTEISLSNAAVPENAPGAVIGTLAAVDPDSGDTFTFAVSDERFEVVGNQLKLKDDVSLDHEPSGVVTVTVTVTDAGGESHTQTFEITVTDVNEAPSAADDEYAVGEDGTLSVGAAEGVLGNDSDVDGDELSAVLLSGPQNGTLTFNADGSFTYTPDANFNGTDSFTYKANDGSADSGVATVTINVNPQNDPPTVTADSHTIAEDGALTVAAAGVLANDTDIDGDALSAVLVSGPENGILILNADGSFTYTPNADFNGTDTFTYKANDGAADSGVATVTIDVTALNDPPVAAADNYTVVEDEPLTVAALAGVLANDTDVDGDPLSAVLVTGPENGTLTFNADGSFTYAPNENFNGVDTFTYQARDGSLLSDPVTVTLTVGAVNDPPVAVSDGFETTEDKSLKIAGPGVLANDTDIDADTLSAVLVTGPSHGQLTLNADGSFGYTPDENFNGTDSFTYKASDGVSGSNVATVTLTVTAQNDAPAAVDDAYAVDEDGTLIVGSQTGLLANDGDVENDALTAVLVGGPAHGQLTLNPDGSFTYTPDENFEGADSFTYKANDGTADGNVATVTLTVNPQNDAPVAAADSYTIAEDGTLIVEAGGVLANDTDIDGDALSAVLVSGPENGTLELNADGSFTFTPNANFDGTDTFTYKANDGTADSGVATVTITVDPQNDAPVATGDAYAIAEDGTLIVQAGGVLANDTDIDGDVLSAALVSGPGNGTLTLNADGSFTYTPDENFNGTDTFTYKANDGTADSGVATVTITVGPQNDPPVATGDAYKIAEDGTLTVEGSGVLANDTDIDGDALSAVLVGGPENGTLTLNADGSFTYTPNANFNGTDSFTYKANDGTADSGIATVTITVDSQNDAPVAKGDAYAIAEDGTLIVEANGVLANDTDLDGDALSAVLVGGPANGTLTLNADGSFTYTPNANFNGTDTFTYKANDGTADSGAATVTITVGPQNDAPVAAGDAYVIAEDSTLIVAAAGVLANDTDVDGDALSAVLVSGPANGALTLNADGTFTYTPDKNFNGTDTFAYKANDGTADSSVATVTITVDPQNDAPVTTGDAYAIAEDSLLTVAAAGVLTNDTDVDGDALTAVLVSGPANGTLTLNADGSFTYTPNSNFNGTDTFTYKANGGTADSGIATVTIDVGAKNDAPAAADDAYTIAEDGTLSIAAQAGLLANDSDVDGDDLSAVLVAGPQNGVLTLNPDGSFTYTPNADFNGTDTFTYKANDGAAESDVATVTITVPPQNDAPVAQADKYAIAEDGTLTVAAKAGVLANDTDIDGDKLTAVIVDGPDHGKLVLNPDGSFVYTPDADFNGPDSFTYKTSDGSAASDPVTVTLNVTPVNDPPVAEDDSYDVGQGGTLVVAAKAGVLANDTDIDGGALSVAVASGPEHGELSLNPDGSFTYTSDPTYDGPDSFTYTVSDGLGGTDTATVTLNVADAAPTAADDIVQTADAARQTIDLVIILDRSGSMEESPGVAGFSTRLELARAAIAALFEAYESVADLNIQIVDFASDAASSGWLDSPEEANAYLASLVAGGGTNYTAAIEEAMAAYADAPAADKTEIYFLSDGVPTAGTSLAATGTVAAWEAFLADPANHVDTAFAVGIGNGIATNDPDLADVAFPNGDPQNPTVVTDESLLIDTLVGTVANPVSGNVLLNDDFGPDGKGNGGAGLLTITVAGVTYTFSAGQITNDFDSKVIAGAVLLVPTALEGGTLEFHFDSGDFTYTPPDVDDPQTERFDYTIVDGDGSKIGATLQVEISDSGVVVIEPHIVIGTDGPDSLAGAAGAVDDIVSGGKGADSLAGGDGNDHVQGGADADSLVGGIGVDILIGGAGNDSLDGGTGADVLVGGEGTDRIIVGTGDRAEGGGGNDTIILLDNTGFAAVQGADAAAVNLGASGGDVLAFNGDLDLTALANDRILGIETISMIDGIGGAGADTLTLGAGDVIDIGAGQFDPAGNLVSAPAVRVDGDKGDALDLAGGGWQQVEVGGLPQGYALYLHDSPAAGLTPDAYVLVQTSVAVTAD